MSNGRLDQKVCWYAPKTDEDWDWEKEDRIKAGFQKKTLVYVVEHVYTVNGRLSNFVDFVRVNKNGSLEKAVYSCYDFDQFVIAKEFTLQTKVVRK